MLSHEAIWTAIERLAERHRLTASGLARKAGLDPTAFNKSKRYGVDGRLRWPSTESIAKILEATGEDMAQFVALLSDDSRTDDFSQPGLSQGIPLIGFAKAGAGGFFDDGGFPAGQGWDLVDFPPAPSGRAGTFALEVQGDSMLPLYRHGDVLIIEPTALCRKGDRVVVRSTEGEVMAKILERQSAAGIELKSLNPAHPDRFLGPDEIDWIARIIWASQ